MPRSAPPSVSDRIAIRGCPKTGTGTLHLGTCRANHNVREVVPIFGQPLNRRDVLRLGTANLVGLALAEGLSSARPRAASAADDQSLEPLNRFPRMMQEYFVDRLREFEARRLKRLAGLKTKGDAEAYVESVRERIRESFGPFPEKTPLNPRVMGVVERDAYRIEKVVFESRPDFLVTANLYVPKGRTFPLPGVVGTCGHSSNGKAAEAYQSFAQGLARQGYVVLIFDPLGQGERLQYVDEDFKPKIGHGTREHLHAGNQQFLVGEFLCTWRAWDGIRALDYLLTREEVDPKHVGVTGNSGGGTMTTWLCGVEQRWTMAAPSCFVTSFRRNLENELPADTEQCPPRALALGLDHEDFLAALAPRPIVILAKEKDYFDVRGTQDAFARLKRLYRLLGAEENIELFVGPTFHGYTKENREAMYRWFNRITGVSKAESEPELTIEKDETLWCTRRGQVAELDSRTVFSFTQEKSQALARSRSEPDADELKESVSRLLKLEPPALAQTVKASPSDGTVIGIDAEGEIILGSRRIADPEKVADSLRGELKARPGKKQLTIIAHPDSKHGRLTAVISAAKAAGAEKIRFRLPSPRKAAPEYRILRPLPSRKYPKPRAVTYAVQTEPGIHAIVYRLYDERHYSRPPKEQRRAVLYVSHHSADAELRDAPLVGELLDSEPKAAFYACDLRGIGESRPDTCGERSFLSPYGSDYFCAIHSLMLGRPYVGQKTWDLLRVVDWLKDIGHREVHLAAKEWGTVPATFAALLSDGVGQVTLEESPDSYSEIAESELYDWPLSSFVPNVLADFDLPDCYRVLEGKGLRRK